MMAPLIWAGGGLSQNAPRDTLPAYWGALGAGADGLMLTVQLSKDSQLICAPGPTLQATTGRKKKVSDLTALQIRRLDAGSQFRSQVLDAHLRPQGQAGKDTPWVGHTGKHDALYHPTLDEVFRLFGRRTLFLIHLLSGKGRERKLADAVVAKLSRYAMGGRTILAGSEAQLAAVGGRYDARCLVPADADAFGAAAAATSAGYEYVLVSEDAPNAAWVGSTELRFIIAPGAGAPAVTPATYAHAKDNPLIEGFVAQAADDFQALVEPRGLIVEDGFAGKKANRDLWALGHSRPNDDTKIWVGDGLHIAIDGPNYSGAAALTSYSIFGDFDARMAFHVKNPHQGTTFELAAIHVDPGYRPRDLIFDVHGAPPYASSERDEDDGFRIGWNNGPALTQWVDRVPRSSNLYNNYGRDVGYAKKDSPTGVLRLTRRDSVFNAYYTDKFNKAWVLSGSVPVPALGDAVYLRLGGKHWPKHGDPAPSNEFRFTDFRLLQ